jgi:SAM-dependent methyltransferase
VDPPGDCSVVRQPSSTPTRPQAWNGYEGQHWADNQDRWDAVNAGFTRPLFDAAEIGASDRVLDIGCGNGLTSRLAAGGAADGRTIGMDLSTPMLARARASATRDGIPDIASWFRRAAEKGHVEAMFRRGCRPPSARSTVGGRGLVPPGGRVDDMVNRGVLLDERSDLAT